MRLPALLAFLGLALAQATYVVRPGDTLFSLARRFGVEVATLARANGIADPDRLRAGARLVVPRPANWPKGLDIAPYPLVQGRPAWVRLPPGVGWAALDGARARGYRGRALVPVAATARVGLHRLSLGGYEAAVFVASGRYPTRDLTLPRGKGGLFDPAAIRNERARILAACRKGPRAPLWSGPWRWPVAPPVVSAPFGERRRYNGRPGGYHAGLDLAARAGTPVRAAAPGIVVLTAAFKVRGNAVVLAHGAGVCAIYQHLSRIAAKPGARVAAGAVLGAVGSSGLSTGPHLHLEVRLLGLPQDPRFFLEALR